MWDCAAAFLALICAAGTIAILPTRARENDFAHYYLSGRVLLEGGNPYRAAPGPLYRQYGFFRDDRTGVVVDANTPVMTWLFAGVAWLPPQPAFVVWVGFEVVCLAWILWLTCQQFRGRLTPRATRLVWLGAIASAPVYWHFYYSQVQLLLGAILLTAFAWHRTGRNVLACLAAAIAGLLKLYPFILLPWFLWRGGAGIRDRALRSLVVVLCVGLAVVASGWHLWLDFFQRGVPLAVALVNNKTFNFSAPSLVTNFGYARYAFVPSPQTARAWWCVGAVVGMSIVAAAYVWCIWARLGPAAEFGFLCTAMLLGSPTVWGHYYVLLIFPFVVAVMRWRRFLSAFRLAWIGAVWLLLNNLCNFSSVWEGGWLDRHIYVKLLLNYLPMYGALGLATLLGFGLPEVVADSKQ
ncbi:MAG: glycosyltransferase family 87 protein [Verrucomicrobiia bacterium]|jgi:hypothetical protein